VMLMLAPVLALGLLGMLLLDFLSGALLYRTAILDRPRGRAVLVSRCGLRVDYGFLGRITVYARF
jgi:hypothetical protein